MNESIQNRKKSGIQTLAFILINLIVIGVILYREFGNGDTINLSGIKFNSVYLFAVLFCFLLILLTDWFKYYFLIYFLSGKKDFKGSLSVMILGRYYDNVTPMGAGGQPFQIFYLSNLGYSAGVSGSVPIVGLISHLFQVAFFGIIELLLESPAQKASPIYVAAWVGIFMVSVVPVCSVFFSFWPRFFGRIIVNFIRFFGKIKLIKDTEKTETKVLKVMTETADGIRTLNSNLKIFLTINFLTLINVICGFVLPFFILRYFGINDDFISTFRNVVLVSLSMAAIPTPGNTGAAESSFYIVFASLPKDVRFLAVVIWRLITYYSWIILGLFYYIKQFIKGKILHKQQENKG